MTGDELLDAKTVPKDSVVLGKGKGGHRYGEGSDVIKKQQSLLLFLRCLTNCYYL